MGSEGQGEIEEEVFGVRTTGEREGKATKGKGGRKRGRARGLGA